MWCCKFTLDLNIDSLIGGSSFLFGVSLWSLEDGLILRALSLRGKEFQCLWKIKLLLQEKEGKVNDVFWSIHILNPFKQKPKKQNIYLI